MFNSAALKTEHRYNVDNMTLWGNRSRKRFFSLHFPDKGRMSGQVIFTGEGFQRIRFERAGGAVADYVEQMHVAKQQYHVAMNTFSGATRDTEHLYALNNIVVDIDCISLHQQDTRLTAAQYDDIERMYHRILYAVTSVYPVDIPMPNTVVYTGRGFSLWFALEQASYQLLPVWQQISRELSRRIAGWLCDIGIEGVQVDIPASTRAAGLARLPGSWHPTAARWGFFSIVHENRIDLLATADDMGFEYVRERSKERKVVALPQSGVMSLVLAGRREMLEQLCSMRKENGTLMGCRDEFLFCIYNSVYQETMDDEAAMEAAERLNLSMGKYALPDRKVTTYLSTSRKKHYFLTDEKIIEHLDILECEMEEIGWTPFSGSLSNRQVAKLRRQEKQRRNLDIIERVAAGEAQAALAREYGIDPSTVSKIVSAAERAAEQERKNGLEQEENKAEQGGNENKIIDFSTAVAHGDRGRSSAPKIGNLKNFEHCGNREKSTNENIFMPTGGGSVEKSSPDPVSRFRPFPWSTSDF